jgi:hypothetical protein
LVQLMMEGSASECSTISCPSGVGAGRLGLASLLSGREVGRGREGGIHGVIVVEDVVVGSDAVGDDVGACLWAIVERKCASGGSGM